MDIIRHPNRYAKQQSTRVVKLPEKLDRKFIAIYLTEFRGTGTFIFRWLRNTSLFSEIKFDVHQQLDHRNSQRKFILKKLPTHNTI